MKKLPKTAPSQTLPRRGRVSPPLFGRGVRGEAVPKKSLGQNFLRDPKILKKIADFAQIEKEDLVLEVGPGEGGLTEELLKQAKKVVAVEKDEQLVDKLKERFKLEIENSKLEIILGDILKIENLLEIAKLKIENYVLVGNIPYYITGALFKKFLETTEHPPKSITFVIQKEVAERIMARGSHSTKASRDKKESILSISIKVYGEPKSGEIIKAGSFFPKPKVDSAILGIRNIKPITPPNPPLGQGREDQRAFEQKFFEILKAGFAHKRKFLLRNLLDAKIPRVPPGISEIKEVFRVCRLDERARAEDLGVGDWLCLTKRLM